MRPLRAILLAGAAFLSIPAPLRADTAAFDAAMAAIAAEQPARAVAIFSRLAEAGDRAAQLNLAVLTARGAGIPQNDLDAAYWAWRARLAGLPDAVAAADALVARLAPDAQEQLLSRLAADLEALGEAGADWAFLGLARLELQLSPDPDPARAYAHASLAAALNVRGAAALRDALAHDLDTAPRLAAQAEATARHARLCHHAARSSCAPAQDPAS